MKKLILDMFVAVMGVGIVSQSAQAGFMRFPLNGYTPSTTPVTAVVDLNKDLDFIQTRTGEIGSYYDGCLAHVNGQNVVCNTTNTSAPRAYKRSGGGAWSVTGIDYRDLAPGENLYMWYDNHKGYDYAVSQGTPVYAVATGTLVSYGGAYGEVTLDHGNGYQTRYLHMYVNAPLPYTINKGQHIGWVSNVSPSPVGYHLHFEAKRNINGIWTPVDPYGGNGQPVLWE